MADFYATRGLRNNLNRERAEALLDIQLKNVFDQLPNKLPSWEEDRDELFQLISTQDCPGEYFDFLGHGSYKEAYVLHRSHNYVVKFCSQQNDTETEKALLNAARSEGIAYAFIPTYFINFHGLTCGMPFMLEDYDGESDQDWDSENSTWVENENWEGRYATALEIQPILDHTTNHRLENKYWSFDYAYGESAAVIKGVRQEPDHQLYDPAIDPNTGEVIPYDIVSGLEIHCKHWIEEFARYYGIDGLTNLANFVQKYHVSDLHHGNLGYIADESGNLRPVIIDWLSWDKNSIKKIQQGLN